MKIALCFSGQPRFIKESASLIKENIIQDYDVDVFSHLWFDEGLQQNHISMVVLVDGFIKEYLMNLLMIL